jgi:hypothetical protein
MNPIHAFRRPRKSILMLLLLSSVFAISARAEDGNNFHRIDPPEGATVADKKNSPNDKNPNFSIYRTGKPDFVQFEHMVCDLGITETYVLSNNGNEVEEAWNDKELSEGRCKEKFIEKHFDKVTHKEVTVLKRPMVVNTFAQNVKKHTLTAGFLKQFDDWVKKAQTSGKKIAFRCNCGCHRTGRVAAYYEMAYMGKVPGDKHDPDSAVAELFDDAHQKTGDILKDLAKDAYWSLDGVGRSLKFQVQALYDFIHKVPCSTKEKFCVDPSLSTTESSRTLDPAAGNVDLDDLVASSKTVPIEVPENARNLLLQKTLPSAATGEDGNPPADSADTHQAK